jgi:hypothetical protein
MAAAQAKPSGRAAFELVINAYAEGLFLSLLGDFSPWLDTTRRVLRRISPAIAER